LGLLDPNKIDLRDPDFYLRLGWMLSLTSRQLQIEELDGDIQHSMFAEMVKSTPEAWDAVISSMYWRRSALRPWENRSWEETKRLQAAELEREYKASIGDPDDPEYKKKIDATVAELLGRLETSDTKQEVAFDVEQAVRDRREKRRRRRTD